MPEDKRLTRLYRWLNLETGLIAGALGLLIGVVLLLLAVWRWYERDFGSLDYVRTMRLVIPGVTLTALGVQTMLSSFFLSILGMKSK